MLRTIRHPIPPHRSKTIGGDPGYCDETAKGWGTRFCGEVKRAGNDKGKSRSLRDDKQKTSTKRVRSRTSTGWAACRFPVVCYLSTPTCYVQTQQRQPEGGLCRFQSNWLTCELYGEPEQAS